MTHSPIPKLHLTLTLQQEQLRRGQTTLRAAIASLSIAARIAPALKDRFEPLLALDADFDNRLAALETLRFEVDAITGDDEVDALKGQLKLLQHPFTAPARTGVTSLLN